MVERKLTIPRSEAVGSTRPGCAWPLGDLSLLLVLAGVLVVTGIWSWATWHTGMQDLGGPVLFVLLMALLVGNLYRTGRVAASKRAG